MPVTNSSEYDISMINPLLLDVTSHEWMACLVGKGLQEQSKFKVSYSWHVRPTNPHRKIDSDTGTMNTCIYIGIKQSDSHKMFIQSTTQYIKAHKLSQKIACHKYVFDQYQHSQGRYALPLTHRRTLSLLPLISSTIAEGLRVSAF